MDKSSLTNRAIRVLAPGVGFNLNPGPGNDPIIVWDNPAEALNLALIEAKMVELEPGLDGEISNAPLLVQIDSLERSALRQMRTLMRDQHFPSDVPAAEKAFAQNKIRQIDMDIENLRSQLQ